MRTWIVVGALNMAIAIALGAFGTHALKGTLSDLQLTWWGTAQQYHVWNSLGIILFGHIGQAGKWPVRLLAFGIVLFSGSLYLMALTDAPWLGAVTPFGGACLILGWVTFALGVVRSLRDVDKSPNVSDH